MVVTTTPGLAETLAADRQKTARFYARLGITESQLRHGARDAPEDEADNPEQPLGLRYDGTDRLSEGE